MKNDNQVSFARQYFLHRYWILASVILCVVSAFFYLSTALPQYRVNAQTRFNQQTPISPLQMNSTLESLKSISLLKSTVEQLSLQVAYLQNGNGKIIGLYGNEVPIKILTDAQDHVVSNGSLKISPTDYGFLQINGGEDIRLVRLDSVFDESFGQFRAVKGPAYGQNKSMLIVKISLSDQVAEQYRENLVITTGRPDEKILNLSLLDINPSRGADYLEHLIKTYNSRSLHVVNPFSLPNRKIQDSLFLIQNEIINLKARNTLLKEEKERPKDAPKVKPVKKTLSFNDQQQLNIYNVIEPYLKVSIKQFDLVPYAEEIQDLNIRKSVDQYNKTQAEKQTKLRTFKENDPEINTINKQLISFQKNIIVAIEGRKSQIKSQFVSAQPPISTINKSGKQDSIAKIETLIQEKITTLGLLTAKISKTTTVSENTGQLLITQKPTSSDEPEYPRYWLTYFFAFIIGLIPPLIIPYAKSDFEITPKEKVNRSDDINEHSGIPIYITIQQLAPTFINPGSTNKNYQIILVTGVNAVKGQTAFINDLAHTLSAEDKRTVILDLNLREPGDFEGFEIGNRVGVTNFLKKEITEVEKLLILSKSNKNVYLIPAGMQVAKNADPISSFFSSNDLVSPWGDENHLDKLVNDPLIGVLIDRLRSDFSYIILNAPSIVFPADLFPIVAFADTEIITTTPASRIKQLKSIDDLVKRKRFNNPVLYNFDKDA